MKDYQDWAIPVYPPLVEPKKLNEHLFIQCIIQLSKNVDDAYRGSLNMLQERWLWCVSLRTLRTISKDLINRGIVGTTRKPDPSRPYWWVNHETYINYLNETFGSDVVEQFMSDGTEFRHPLGTFYLHVGEAKSFGLIPALLFDRLWGKANGSLHIMHNGKRYWGMGHDRIISEWLPFVSAPTVERAVSKLKRVGVIDVAYIGEGTKYGTSHFHIDIDNYQRHVVTKTIAY